MDALEALRTEFAKDDEVDYVGLAFQLRDSAWPALEQLVSEDEDDDDARRASQAVYLAALIDGSRSLKVVGQATRSRQAIVRVAAAFTLPRLPLIEAATSRCPARPRASRRSRGCSRMRMPKSEAERFGLPSRLASRGSLSKWRSSPGTTPRSGSASSRPGFSARVARRRTGGPGHPHGRPSDQDAEDEDEGGDGGYLSGGDEGCTCRPD